MEQQGKILIIDDEPANVRVLERMLGRAGYQDYLATTDSRQAMALFQSARFDMILLDLAMPHVDGFALLEQFQASIGPENFLPIIVLTADVTPEARRRALSLGAGDGLRHRGAPRRRD
jgi:CheY-like chemotaxis protein